MTDFPKSEIKNGGDKPKIYHTTYKKGPVLGHLHFEHFGPFEEAVLHVKEWCKRKNLKHIHTVKFLVDLDNDGEDLPCLS